MSESLLGMVSRSYGGPKGNYKQPAGRQMYFWGLDSLGTNYVWVRKPLLKEY
jgi:hypothetical protein